MEWYLLKSFFSLTARAFISDDLEYVLTLRNERILAPDGAGNVPQQVDQNLISASWSSAHNNLCLQPLFSDAETIIISRDEKKRRNKKHHGIKMYQTNNKQHKSRTSIQH